MQIKNKNERSNCQHCRQIVQPSTKTIIFPEKRLTQSNPNPNLKVPWMKVWTTVPRRAVAIHSGAGLPAHFFLLSFTLLFFYSGGEGDGKMSKIAHRLLLEKAVADWAECVLFAYRQCQQHRVNGPSSFTLASFCRCRRRLLYFIYQNKSCNLLLLGRGFFSVGFRYWDFSFGSW